MKTREHLFISYAWEDGALAEWLTRKLTAEGYRVWCDRFQLLGGESYPTDIDAAIRDGAFRVIALLSRHSVKKPNPLKERTHALNIAREREQEFLIPLNLENLPPTELGWMLSDLTFIPFADWLSGYKQLVNKLQKVDTPRPLSNRGGEIAASTYTVPNVLLPDGEHLWTNCLEVLAVPNKMLVFEGELPRSPAHRDSLRNAWAFYDTPDGLLLAFNHPPQSFPLRCKLKERTQWNLTSEIGGLQLGNIGIHLLERETQVHFVSRGLAWDPIANNCYFEFQAPGGLKLEVERPGHRKSRVKVSGRRTYQGKRYLYSIVPDLRMRRDLFPGVLVGQLRMRVRITDVRHNVLDKKAAVPRRKALTHSWFNSEWMAKQLAILKFLGHERGYFKIDCEDGSIVVSTSPISASCGTRINDDLVEAVAFPDSDLQRAEELGAE